MGKMRKLGILAVSLIAVVVVFVAVVFAFGGPAPKDDGAAPVVVLGNEFVIDDFESGSLSTKGWWTFDLSEIGIVANDTLKLGGEDQVGNLGNSSLRLKGQAKNWYAGGCGIYVAKENQDLAKFNSLKIDVYGNGEGSGTLKIELFDDDNNNWQVEQDRAKNYAAVHDDKLTYDILVDWEGWQTVEVLLDDFVDDNDGVGDDIWNPAQKDGSGGLLQVQFVCLAAKDRGVVNINVDNVRLAVNNEE